MKQTITVSFSSYWTEKHCYVYKLWNIKMYKLSFKNIVKINYYRNASQCFKLIFNQESNSFLFSYIFQSALNIRFLFESDINIKPTSFNKFTFLFYHSNVGISEILFFKRRLLEGCFILVRFRPRLFPLQCFPVVSTNIISLLIACVLNSTLFFAPLLKCDCNK